MNNTNQLVQYAQLYGVNNGLYVAAFVFTAVFSLTFIFKKNHRNFGTVFLLAAVAFLLLGTFNLYFQSHHVGDISKISYPAWVLWVGKCCPPVLVSIFAYLFLSETALSSRKAYNILSNRKPVLAVFASFNVACLVALVLIGSETVALTIGFGLFIFYLLVGVYYLHTAMPNTDTSKVLRILFLLSALLHIVNIICVHVGYGLFSSIAVYLAHLCLAVFTLVFAFIGIRFGAEQLRQFDAEARGKNRALIRHINDALKNNEFFMVYQPKLDIHENKVCGVEALIRWQHPKLGFIRPDEFIPVAETSHLIDGICEWVITETSKQAKIFADAGYYLPISINFSVKNLQPSIVEFLFETIEKNQLDTGALVVEVTETVFMQNSDMEKQALAMLHGQNIPLSLDDYGTGFSSLSSINQMALSEIKIDRGFVSDLAENHEHHIIVRSTLRMSKELGVKVVAEGVEELDMIETLKDMHCDIVQGYGIAKPMKADEMISWLRESGYAYIRKQIAPSHGMHKLNV